MSASSGPRQASDAGKEVHALSCINCRQRKVKCTKTFPCPHCLRGGLECIFPARKKDRRPRTNRNHELLNRLAKLEAIVGQVDPDAVSANPGHPPLDAGSAAQATDKAVAQPTRTPAQQVADSELRNPQKRCPTAQPVSKDDPVAKYVSGEFWAGLSREVEGIKAILEQPSDDEDDDEGENDGTSPESHYQGSHGSHGSLNYSMSSPTVLGNGPAVSALSHPPPARMKALCDVYFRSVDPLMKILHKPTVEKTFDLYIMNPSDHPLSRTTEALFFAMYFGAVTSMQPDSCVKQLGEDRRVLSVQYKQAVEHALARADYLNSTSLETLQAFMIYSVSLSDMHQALSNLAGVTLIFWDRLVYATTRNLAPHGRY